MNWQSFAELAFTFTLNAGIVAKSLVFALVMGLLGGFLPALRASRNRVNKKGGDWLFAPDVRCASHAKEARLLVQPGSLILLASDGFFALVSDYGRYSAEGLMSAAEQGGLAALGKELRAIEAADPKGLSFPRFKSSDDATAVLLSLAR